MSNPFRPHNYVLSGYNSFTLLPTSDSTARLRQELRECQRKLEELSQRLEEEADRRKESDTWGRTLEKDLHDHVITRRIAEEKVSDLSGQLQDLRQRNRDSEQRNKQLSLELKLITDAASDAKDMLPDSKTLCMDSDHGNGRCNALPCAQPRLESPLSGSSGGTIHQPVGRGPGMDSKDADTYDEEYDEDNEEDYDESTDEEEEDYEEEREAGEAELELIKRSIIPRPPSDENFELGKDVMGALIAKAFKGRSKIWFIWDWGCPSFHPLPPTHYSQCMEDRLNVYSRGGTKMRKKGHYY